VALHFAKASQKTADSFAAMKTVGGKDLKIGLGSNQRALPVRLMSWVLNSAS
jgi:hypothetical protein